MPKKSDLLKTWCEGTTEPVAEARHRIRVLSEADLLPFWNDPLTYADIARAILGFLVPDKHRTAAEEVRQTSEFHFHTCVGGTRDESIRVSSLLDAMQIAFKAPNVILSIKYSSIRQVDMDVINIDNHSTYTFLPKPDSPNPLKYSEFTNSRTIHCGLIQQLLSLVEKE